MKRAWLLLPIAALATLVIIPLTTAFGDDDADGPSILAVDVAADFTYQGRFVDDGSPADGEYDIRFILYDAEAGGTQVGATVSKENMDVSDGLFTTTLNFGGAAFTGEARWLEIAVRPGASDEAFTVLNPRQPVTAVPYALHALTAGGFTPPLTVTGSEDVDPLIGVTQSGSAAGVLVTSTAAGGIGIDSGASGAGGIAGAFTGDTALFIEGGIQTGIGPMVPAFKLYADPGTNTCDNGGADEGLIIDSPLANGDPFAVILLTHDSTDITGVEPLVVEYDAGNDCPDDKWIIRFGNGASWTGSDIVNVLIINQTVIQ